MGVLATVGWQAAMVSSAMMRGALNELPNWQGKIENDWRDEQPSPWSLTAGVGDRIKDLMESLIP
jgi:hypothetical protein